MNTSELTFGSELSVQILAEIAEAIIVTDLDHHILYWNRAAERLYGMRTEEALGHRLALCCPSLEAALGTQHLPNRCLEAGDSWDGEVRLESCSQPVSLAVSISLIHDAEGKPIGILYLQRDVTEVRNLERELVRQHERLSAMAVTKEPAPALSSVASTPAPGNPSSPLSSAPRKVVLWAEDDDDDAILMARAWQKAEVDDQLIRVPTGAEVIQYLLGQGQFGDRSRYPLPRMLVLDLDLPGVSGLDLVKWVHEQPAFEKLPVVILTCSAAPRDIHQAARLHVKGYLAKPAEAEEWLMKVRTLTSQCV